MKQYFIHITADYWATHNKAENQVRKLAHSLNRCIITEDKVNRFVGEFRDKIKDIYKQHPRCNELPLYREKRDRDILLYCGNVFRMSLLEIKLPINEIRTVDELVPKLDSGELGFCTENCNYADAVADVPRTEDIPDINWVDAEAFFNEGYEHARKILHDAKVLLQVIPELSN